MEFCRRFSKNKAALIGLVLFLIIFFFAVFANLFVDYEVDAIGHSADRLAPPSIEHIFGTDGYGRDTFARVLYGTRNSLEMALTATVCALGISIIIGAVAAFYGGILDSIIMRVLDMFMGIPVILLAIAVSASLGPGKENLILAIIIAQIPQFTRVTRSAILNVVGQEYVEAARAYGSSDISVIVSQILPNTMGLVIIQATMAVAQIILSIAALSYLGLGIQPPAPELGSMLSEGREYMRYSQYIMLFPGLMIALTALSLNLIGDGLRDALDPRLKN
ncbi:ABC transporter permease [Angelakisella massiliensis]|uniref:ABC transporter permease n=1 Tax=Angelakisella massiliensis TaxID=1871018 RepID=UPI001F40AF52|nr:ABC transporter permease [Angelakisella massiliensis]